MGVDKIYGQCILGIHGGNIPPPKKKSYIPPKTCQFFFVFGPRIIHCQFVTKVNNKTVV